MKMCLTLGLVLMASIATAAEQTRPTITDVALQQNGVLSGQVINTAGVPHAQSQVVLVKDGKLIASTMTNAKGEFAVTGVNPGLYVIEAPVAGGVYRVWQDRTAPPSAKNGVLMIGDTEVVRGQKGSFLDCYGPALRGAIAGAAIATAAGFALDYNPPGS